MHIIGFVIPDLILNDFSENICYKFMKVEQAGERLHNLWNTLTRSRFFSVNDKKKKMLLTFKEYENMLYLNKKLFV